MNKSSLRSPRHLAQRNPTQNDSLPQRQLLHPILRLQQTIGNQAVAELLQSGDRQQNPKDQRSDSFNPQANGYAAQSSRGQDAAGTPPLSLPSSSTGVRHPPGQPLSNA